jgi:hypothetical protein
LILAIATEGPAVLDSTSRSQTVRNDVDMPGSTAALEHPVEMRASYAETLHGLGFSSGKF